MYKIIFLLTGLLLSQIGYTGSYNVTLQSQQTVVVNNATNSYILAQCVIGASNMATNSVSIYMLRGNATFNGTTILTGNRATQIIFNNQYIPVTASVGAEAQLTNLSTYPIKLQCEF